MGSENQFARLQIQLLKHFSDMPVAEHRIRGKIVGNRNEVSAGIRFLSRAPDARLRIGNNSTLPID
jgi:hypothetical protein